MSLENHFIQLNSEPIYGRDEDCEKLKNLLQENNVVVLYGDRGCGKNKLVKEFYRQYYESYDLVLTISELNYSIEYYYMQFMRNKKFQKDFQEANCSLKTFLENSQLKYLVVLANMSQYEDDNEFINNLEKYLPLSSKLKDDQHFILQRYHSFETLGFKCYELNPISKKSSISHFKDTLKVELKQEVEEHLELLEDLYSVTQGAIGFQTILCKYINHVVCETILDSINEIKKFIKNLLEKEDKKAEYFKLLIEYIKKKLGSNYDIFQVIIWFHNYDVHLLWVENIFKEYKVTGFNVESYMQLMVDIGIYEKNNISYTGYKNVLFTLRESMTTEEINLKKYEFLYGISLFLRMKDSRAQVMLLARHLLWYVDENKFELNTDRVLFSTLAAEIYADLFYNFEMAYQLANKNLTIMPKDYFSIEGRNHKILGKYYRRGDLVSKESMKKAVYHLKLAIELLTKSEKEMEFFSKVNLYNLLGSSYSSLEDYDSALKIHNQALGFCKDESGYDYSDTNCYIGRIYFETKNYSKAIHIIRQATIYAKKHQQYKILVIMYGLLCLSYAMNNEISKAEEFINLIKSQKDIPKESYESILLDCDRVLKLQKLNSNFTKYSYILGGLAVLSITGLIIYKKMK